jgi:hypothetical protein
VAHLEVDPTVLSDMAADLRRCVGVAREFADHRGHLKDLAEGCGSEALREAAEHFISRWGYGMGLVVADAEQLAAQLERSADEYRRLEARISQAAR